MNRFNLDDYEPVASRVQRFYDKHPNGSIICALVYDDGTRCVVQATVWRDINDPAPAAVDYAEELLTDRGVNATSRIENCSTSAIGRAISVASAGLGPSDWTKKPSREEMAKVQRRDNGDSGSDLASDKQVNYLRSLYKSRGRPAPATIALLDRHAATKLIDGLKGDTLTEDEERELLHAGRNDKLMGDEEPF